MQLRDVLIRAMLASALGCQALAEPDVDYVDCVARADGRYVERFEASDRHTPWEHCWETDNVPGRSGIQTSDGDLIIDPDESLGARWSETEQAPFFSRPLAGDFFAITRAEAASGQPTRDHCLEPDEAAGFAVRRREPFAWATLFVQPDLTADELNDSELCGDEPMNPPPARVVAQSHGFAQNVSSAVGEKGEDAEAYIALCRVDNRLFFFYQARVPTQDYLFDDLDDEGIDSIDVGHGPLDVGLTATADPHTDTLPEGHFPWLVLEDYSVVPADDGCNSVLESFEQPEPP